MGTELVGALGDASDANPLLCKPTPLNHIFHLEGLSWSKGTANYHDIYIYVYVSIYIYIYIYIYLYMISGPSSSQSQTTRDSHLSTKCLLLPLI